MGLGGEAGHKAELLSLVSSGKEAYGIVLHLWASFFHAQMFAAHC